MKHKGGMDIRVTKDGRRAFSLSFAGVEAVTSTALTWWDLQVARRIWGPVVSDTVGGAFLINGETQVLTWGRNGRIRRWDLSNGQPIGEELYCTGAEVGPERISEVGPERISNVILAEDEQTMIVWRDNAWLHNPTFALCNANCGLIGPKMKGTPEGTAVSKDLRRALTWLPDGNLQLWDVATGKPLGPVLDRGVHGAIFMRDERRAISWSNNVIRQWDLETSLGREINHAGVVGAAVTNDGRRILSWSNELRIWDAETARQISPVIRSKNEFRGAALTNDEKRVISWSSEDVRVWDVASGRQIGPAMTIQHFHGKEALLLSDQKRVLTWGGLKYELLVWDIELPRGNLLELACAALADPTLGQIAQQYGVKDPICGPGLADTLTDWSKIELAPAAAVEAAR
jgi:WD40 repeat protein